MSEYFEVITDAVTGEVTVRDLTDAEITALLPTAEQVRSQREEILSNIVDPIVSNPLRWADFTPEQQQAWINYRRALLDISQQSGFPTSVLWPEVPA